MKLFSLLPRRLSHFACNSPLGLRPNLRGGRPAQPPAPEISQIPGCRSPWQPAAAILPPHFQTG